MKIAKIKTSFATYTDAQVVLQAQNIVAGLTGNASFPTPEPTLETVSTAITAFTDALEAAREGSRTLITIKNTRRAELEALLRTLGAYVTLAANGDKAKLQSSLFPLAKDGEPTPPIAAPQNLVMQLARLRRMIDRQGEQLLEEALANLLKNGDIGRHLKKSNKIYHERRDLFCSLLREQGRHKKQWGEAKPQRDLHVDSFQTFF